MTSKRNAETEPVVVDVRRRNVIVETAPVVPHDEDGGAVPKRAFADGVDERRDPRGPVPPPQFTWSELSHVGVIHVTFARYRLDVRDELRLRRDDVFFPVGSVANVANCLIPGPTRRRRCDVARVEAPAQSGRVELVAERRCSRSRPLLVADLPLLGERGDLVALAAVAAPVAVREIDARCACAGDDVLVRHEALVEMRLEHRVGEHAFVRHVEVRLRFLVRHVHVLRVLRTAGRTLQVEPVHTALRSRQSASPTIARRDHRICEWSMTYCRLETDRLQRDLVADVIVAESRGVRARIAVEHVVERAVLLHDDDDVLDLAARAHGSRQLGLPNERDDGIFGRRGADRGRASRSGENAETQNSRRRPTSRSMEQLPGVDKAHAPPPRKSGIRARTDASPAHRRVHRLTG